MGGFRRTVLAALVSGVVAGLLLSAVQRWQVVPLIEQAEVIEGENAEQNESAKTKPSSSRVIVLDGGSPQTVESHHHDHGGHGHGTQRVIATIIANSLIGIGFGLLLAGAMLMHGRGGALSGLVWGLCGFLVFYLVPALGMPPKLPGSLLAPLLERQTWWWLAASCTAVALALMLLQRNWLARIAGLAILAVPFVAGTPKSQADAASPVSAEMLSSFFWATGSANLLFWLVLGLVCGAILGRRKGYDDFLVD